MKDIETRYRRSLHWYPASWRALNEEVIVGTLLDKAEQENRDRPLAGELVDLALHGTLGHVALLRSVIPASVRERASTAALGIGAAMSLVAIAELESGRERYPLFHATHPATFGPFASTAIIVYLVWVVALVAAVVGWTKTSRILVAASIPATVAARLLADRLAMDLRPTWTFLGLLILLAAIAAIGRPAPDRRGALWLGGWFAASVIVFVLPHVTDRQTYPFQNPMWLDERGHLLAYLPAVAIVAAIVSRLLGSVAWSAATLILALPWAVLAVFGGRETDQLLVSGIAVCAVMVLPLIVVGLFRLLGVRISITRA